jgi:hypothetical protein
VISGSGYAPVYYGNTTAGSAFGLAWCATVGQRPEIQASSYLWSFEPDLYGRYARQTAPAFAPYYTGCGGQYDAWQYQISDGSTPLVDHDEATSRLPLWYPLRQPGSATIRRGSTMLPETSILQGRSEMSAYRRD